MSAYSLKPFRRCRAMFALALCAWLMLVSMAWAQQGCCSTVHGQTGAAMVMAMDGHASMSAHSMHGDGHDTAHAGDKLQAHCTCACVSATVPQVASVAPPAAIADSGDAAYFGGEAPQPTRIPPLRPPAA
ncbi:hypothetical protein [Dyella silvatica]|uniref:hypothetical protein n=1 Tax=Dyella silvatica TaxID=2992128 RepID=UPI00224D50C9|nr:hypothetical protein [Dyella silvatica]